MLNKKTVFYTILQSYTDSDSSEDDKVPIERRGFCGTVNYLKSNPITPSSKETTPLNSRKTTAAKEPSIMKSKVKPVDVSKGSVKRVYHSSESEDGGQVVTSDWRKCQSSNISNGYDDYINNDISCYGETAASSIVVGTMSNADDCEDADIFDMIESGAVDNLVRGGGDCKPSKKKKAKKCDETKVAEVKLTDTASKSETKKLKKSDSKKKNKVIEVVDSDDDSKSNIKSEPVIEVIDSDGDEGKAKKKLKSKKVEVSEKNSNAKEIKDKKEKVKKIEKINVKEKLRKPEVIVIQDKQEEGLEESEENNYKMKFDKRKQSNEKRLSSLKNKQSDTQNQQAKISQALKHIVGVDNILIR